MFSEEEEVEMQASALKIQAISRGRKQRRGNRRQEKATVKVTKKTEEELAAAKLQACQRGLLSRRRVTELKEQKKSANKLQAIQRGRADRRKVEAKKTGGLVLQVQDIKAGLTQLARNPFTLSHSYVTLKIGGLGLKNIEEVVKYGNLQNVDCHDNVICDISCLAALPSLLTLDASSNKLTECLSYVVPKCTSTNRWAEGTRSVGSLLTSVDLSNNLIESVCDLAPHQYLASLNLSNNRLGRIQGLNLPLLTYLNLSGNNLKKIEGLGGCVSLVELDLTNNSISNISNLGGVTKLSRLYLRNNSISSLAGLQDCQLRELDVSNNAITVIRQVEHVQNMSVLAKLCLVGNECCGKEFYRLRVISRVRGLSELDDEVVSAKEKIKSINLYGGEGSDLENRVAVFRSLFGGGEEAEAEWENTLPPFVEDEAELELEGDGEGEGEGEGGWEEKKWEGAMEETGRKSAELFVGGVMSDAMKSIERGAKLE